MKLSMTVECVADQDGKEFTDSCSCCGRPICCGAGELRTEKLALVDYWYRWAEGHAGRFMLAIAFRDTEGEPIENGGVVVASGRVESESIIYTVLSPEDSPWSDFGIFGQVIDREAALSNADATNLFGVIDSICVNENRLSSRILECGLKS